MIFLSLPCFPGRPWRPPPTALQGTDWPAPPRICRSSGPISHCRSHSSMPRNWTPKQRKSRLVLTGSFAVRSSAHLPSPPPPTVPSETDCWWMGSVVPAQNSSHCFPNLAPCRVVVGSSCFVRSSPTCRQRNFGCFVDPAGTPTSATISIPQPSAQPGRSYWETPYLLFWTAYRSFG